MSQEQSPGFSWAIDTETRHVKFDENNTVVKRDEGQADVEWSVVPTAQRISSGCHYIEIEVLKNTGQREMGLGLVESQHFSAWNYKYAHEAYNF